jgi:hypothetical protein
MSSKKTNSRYVLEGRLADVIAAITVLAGAKESEGSLKMWTYRLSRPAEQETDTSEKHWQNVFEQHPEFFLAYEWEGEKKAALRLRYANKTIDRKTGQPHPDFQKLNAKERGELTSLPLDPPATGTLITTAVSLHQATLARKADARFFFQTFGPALLALLGALIGVVVPGFIKHPSTEPLKVVVEVLKLEGLNQPPLDGAGTDPGVPREPKPGDKKGDEPD